MQPADVSAVQTACADVIRLQIHTTPSRCQGQLMLLGGTRTDSLRSGVHHRRIYSVDYDALLDSVREDAIHRRLST